METKKLTLVEKAEKVVTFKQRIYALCNQHNVRKPSDEKISEYIDGGYGMNVEDFMHDYTHFEGIFSKPHEPSPLEKATLEATLDMLSEEQLAVLWNVFAQEVGLGNEAIIYDLEHKSDEECLRKQLRGYRIDIQERYQDARFVRFNEGEVTIITDIADFIAIQWPSIFDRILLYPNCYLFDYAEGTDYFTNVIAPTMIEMLGYEVELGVDMVTYKGEK